MSSRFSTRRSSRSSDSSAVASSSARSSASNVDVVGCAGWSPRPWPTASGVRRSWLTAASSAVRIRSASASGRAAAACSASRSLAQRDGGLGGERLQHPAVGGGAAPGRAATSARSSSTGTSTSPVLGAVHGAAADAGRDPPGARLARRPGVAVGRALQQGDRRPGRRSPGPAPAAPAAAGSPRSTLPARVDRVSRLGARPGPPRWVRRAARSTTALTATATATKTTSASEVLRLGDGEAVQRRGEEVVEQQEADRPRRPAPASSPPTRATPTTSGQEEQDVAGSARSSRSGVSTSGQQRQPDRGERRARRAAGARPSARRRAAAGRRPVPTSSWVTRCTSIGAGLARWW